MSCTNNFLFCLHLLILFVSKPLLKFWIVLEWFPSLVMGQRQLCRLTSLTEMLQGFVASLQCIHGLSHSGWTGMPNKIFLSSTSLDLTLWSTRISEIQFYLLQLSRTISSYYGFNQNGLLKICLILTPSTLVWLIYGTSQTARCCH